MELWFGVAIGAVTASLLMIAVFQIFYVSRHWIGTLRIDRSDPDEPYYFMEVKKGFAEKLQNSKLVMLDVETASYLGSITK